MPSDVLGTVGLENAYVYWKFEKKLSCRFIGQANLGSTAVSLVPEITQNVENERSKNFDKSLRTPAEAADARERLRRPATSLL